MAGVVPLVVWLHTLPHNILTDPAECHAWLSAPWDEASKLQRPLPDGVLKIVASGDTRPTVSCRRRFWLNKSYREGQVGPCLTAAAHRPLPERRPYVGRYAGARTLQQRSLRHTLQVESSYLLC
jgi:hypothetical protein